MNRIASAAAALTLASSLAAGAATIDLTDPGAFAIASGGTTATGTAGGVGFTLTAFGGRLNNDEAGPGALAGGLSGLRDGLGIGNDEITFGRDRLVLSFDREVTVTSFFALDLFREVADPTVDEGFTVNGGAPFYAQATMMQDPFGFARFDGLGLTGRTFSFEAVATNDGRGSPDFALAGVSFSVVPVPASGLLLATALGGAVVLRRRKARKASA